MTLPFLRTLAALSALMPLAASAVEPATPAGSIPADLIRTPPAPATPRINGPRVYGARPGHPFFYHLPVTGEHPVTFAAEGLPSGLTLHPQTGNVAGTTAERGAYAVKFVATNARGTDKATVSVVIGDTICLTPPMGYNSWNHFAREVSTDNMRAAADAMVSSGLIDHGWTYVNIDDCWQGERDAQGNIQGNEKFPDLKGLGDYIHAKGLKFGVYSSPGPKTCARFLGSYQHEDQDALSYAKWGVDYVKYDLCSYSNVIHERLRGAHRRATPPGSAICLHGAKHGTRRTGGKPQTHARAGCPAQGIGPGTEQVHRAARCRQAQDRVFGGGKNAVSGVRPSACQGATRHRLQFLSVRCCQFVGMGGEPWRQ